MASLFPSLPALVDLTGRGVVILAGDSKAARFGADCLQAGAGVVIIHPKPSEAAAALSPPARLIVRRWRAADFRNAALVAAGHDEPRMARARASAKSARAIFLALDGGPESDLTLGEAASLGPFTIGLWSSGLPAALGEALRKRVERAAPPRLSGFLAAAGMGMEPRGLSPAERRQFWRDALAAALKAAPPDWEAWLAARVSAAEAAARKDVTDS